MKKVKYSYYWLFGMLLYACAPHQNGDLTGTAIPITTPSKEFAFQVLPTLPPFSTLAPTPDSVEIPSVLPEFSLKGYVAVFKKDGDLFFQDEEDAPIKLAHIEGENTPPYFVRISDDNQKIVFYQDGGSIYSINTDGTHEQIIIPNTWLGAFETDTVIEEVNFVPNTHIMSFQTVWCKEKSPEFPCSKIIFLADTNTGEIIKLVDLGLTIQDFDLTIHEIKFFTKRKDGSNRNCEQCKDNCFRW